MKKPAKKTTKMKPVTKSETKLVEAMTKIGPIKIQAKFQPVNRAVGERLAASIARDSMDCEPHFAIVMHRVPGNHVVTPTNFAVYVNGERTGMVEKVDIHLDASTAHAIVAYVVSELGNDGPVKQVTHNLVPWLSIQNPDAKR